MSGALPRETLTPREMWYFNLHLLTMRITNTKQLEVDTNRKFRYLNLIPKMAGVSVTYRPPGLFDHFGGPEGDRDISPAQMSKWAFRSADTSGIETILDSFRKHFEMYVYGGIGACSDTCRGSPYIDQNLSGFRVLLRAGPYGHYSSELLPGEPFYSTSYDVLDDRPSSGRDILAILKLDEPEVGMVKSIVFEGSYDKAIFPDDERKYYDPIDRLGVANRFLAEVLTAKLVRVIKHFAHQDGVAKSLCAMNYEPELSDRLRNDLLAYSIDKWFTEFEHGCRSKPESVRGGRSPDLLNLRYNSKTSCHVQSDMFLSAEHVLDNKQLSMAEVDRTRPLPDSFPVPEQPQSLFWGIFSCCCPCASSTQRALQ